jgi:hypothetical protein
VRKWDDDDEMDETETSKLVNWFKIILDGWRPQYFSCEIHFHVCLLVCMYNVCPQSQVKHKFKMQHEREHVNEHKKKKSLKQLKSWLFFLLLVGFFFQLKLSSHMHLNIYFITFFFACTRKIIQQQNCVYKNRRKLCRSKNFSFS